MAGTNNFLVQDKLQEFYRAALFDFPFAATHMMLGGGRSNLDAAAWRAYDAWLAMANEVANRWYAVRAIPAAPASRPASFNRREGPLKLTVLESRRGQPLGWREAR
ncbi:MAG: hypothetical protein ABSG46_03905 [Candidatus Binataceae bacterium]